MISNCFLSSQLLEIFVSEKESQEEKGRGREERERER